MSGSVMLSLPASVFHDGEVVVVEDEPGDGRDGRGYGKRDDAQFVAG
jgi:hypothetical protein